LYEKNEEKEATEKSSQMRKKYRLSQYIFEKLQHIMYSTGAWQNVIRKENRFYSKTIEEKKCTKIKLSGVVVGKKMKLLLLVLLLRV
jgi:hypothetical protein